MVKFAFLRRTAFEYRIPGAYVETPFEKRIVTLIYKRKFSKVPFEKADAPLRKSFSESLFSKITLKRVRFSNKTNASLSDVCCDVVITKTSRLYVQYSF